MDGNIREGADHVHQGVTHGPVPPAAIGPLDGAAVPQVRTAHPDGGVHIVVRAMIVEVRAADRVALPGEMTQKMSLLLSPTHLFVPWLLRSKVMAPNSKRISVNGKRTTPSTLS